MMIMVMMTIIMIILPIAKNIRNYLLHEDFRLYREDLAIVIWSGHFQELCR